MDAVERWKRDEDGKGKVAGRTGIKGVREAVVHFSMTYGSGKMGVCFVRAAGYLALYSVCRVPLHLYGNDSDSELENACCW